MQFIQKTTDTNLTVPPLIMFQIGIVDIKINFYERINVLPTQYFDIKIPEEKYKKPFPKVHELIRIGALFCNF